MTTKIPQHYQLIQPTLDAIRAIGGPATNRDIYKRVAAAMKLEKPVLNLLHKDETSLTEVEFRLMWTRTYLRKAGLIDQVGQGTWVLTEYGKRTLTIDPAAIIKASKQPRTKGKTTRKKKKGKKQTVQVQPREGGRNTLFRAILHAAGKPLHYKEIYQRALPQISSAENFTERLAYAGLHGSASFQRLGDGFFGLQEWQSQPEQRAKLSSIVRTDDNELRFLNCPQPLLPENAHPRAFFDSIMMIKQLVYDAPHLTIRQVYTRLREWAGLSIVQLDGAQDAFDAWYCTGLCAYVDFATDGQKRLQLTLVESDDIAILRSTCLRTLINRVDRMSDLLVALSQLPTPTIAALRSALEGRISTQVEIVRRLNLLWAFEAVRRDGDIWRITRTGEALVAEFPGEDFNLYQNVKLPDAKINEDNVIDYALLIDGFTDSMDLQASPSISSSAIDTFVPQKLPWSEAIVEENGLDNKHIEHIQGLSTTDRTISEFSNSSTTLTIGTHIPAIQNDELGLAKANTLVAATDQVGPNFVDLSIEHLVATFDNVSSSYKFAWFLAILDNLHPNASTLIPINQLQVHMVAVAWPVVNQFDFTTGKQDILIHLLAQLHGEGVFSEKASYEQIIDQIDRMLEQDAKMGAEIRRMGDYVPYRFIRPFVNQALEGVPDRQLNKAIIECAEQAYLDEKSPCLYRFHLNPVPAIEIHPAWADYIRLNAAILRGYGLWNLHSYLKRTFHPITPVSTVVSAEGAANKSNGQNIQRPTSQPIDVSVINSNPQASVTRQWTHGDVRQHMYDALAKSIHILFPLEWSSHNLIIPHHWRNPTYVGSIDNRPVAWKGWSANLAHLDPRFGVAYIDFVENVLPVGEQRSLFGRSFADRLAGMDKFVVAFVAGIDPVYMPIVEKAGFTTRVMGRTIHGCIVVPPEDLLNDPIHAWSGEIVRLVNLKLAISNESNTSQDKTSGESDARNANNDAYALLNSSNEDTDKKRGWQSLFRAFGKRS